LLTDFGLTDGYVGVMKAVALTIAPGAALVDISHGVAPQDVEMGAWLLGTAWRYFPEGSVLLCVVDPGVGGLRRAVALEAHGRTFVGPDNGLFTTPLEDDPKDGASFRCVSLDNPRYHLPSPSATFHGRDIFAPCAAHLVAGVPLAALGSAVDPTSLIRLDVARQAVRHGNEAVGRVAYIDHYGNLITNIGAELARQALDYPSALVAVAGREVRARATHFAGGPADEPFFLQDSSGALAIAVRGGSAAAALGARRGDAVTLRGLAGEA
jgi:S-adenosylmethionine hydrolase